MNLSDITSPVGQVFLICFLEMIVFSVLQESICLSLQ